MPLTSITSKIDSVTHIKADYLRPDPPAPKSVKIEITGKCNYRCGFCALRNREKQPTDSMDMELFKRITQEMRAAGVEEIGVFYLGESLVEWEKTAQAIEWCKSIGFPYVFLTTNGSLAHPWVVDRLMEAGLDSLKFSVNAADEDQFKEIMGVKPALFQKSLENIKAAHYVRAKYGYECGLYASSIQYDGEQQAKMVELVEERVKPYVDEHYWLPLYSMGAQANEREAELGYRPTAGNQGRLGGLVQPLPCWSLMTEGHVRSDGTMSLCCFDADGRFAVGDLTKDTFMNVWHSKYFQEMRSAHLSKNLKGTVCDECVAY